MLSQAAENMSTIDEILLHFSCISKSQHFMRFSQTTKFTDIDESDTKIIIIQREICQVSRDSCIAFQEKFLNICTKNGHI